jgi:DNA topoisomerase-1
MEQDLDRIAHENEDWVNVIREFYQPFSEQLERAKSEMPEEKTEPEYVGRECPKCGQGQLILRWGRFGKFISCERFPDCRHTEPFLEKIGVTCPEDGGEIVERRTRKGRIFFGCANYPECEFTSWKRPLPTPCPHCQGTLVVFNKKHAKCLKCETIFPLDEVQPQEEASLTSN